MVEKQRNLHKPIHGVINGQPCELLTVGYLCLGLRRTSWTLRHWEKIGLFPPAPFVQHPDDSRIRRRLYPSPYVDALKDIGERGYLGRRMDRNQWNRFHDEVRAAYQTTVDPLMERVLVLRGLPPDLADIRGQGHDALPKSRLQVSPPPFILHIADLSQNVAYNAGHCVLARSSSKTWWFWGRIGRHP